VAKVTYIAEFLKYITHKFSLKDFMSRTHFMFQISLILK